MENRNDDFPIKPLLFLGIAYAFYEIVTTITYAIARLLHGLVTIALVSAGILALYWVYRHITDKQYGETKKVQQIAKWEKIREQNRLNIPEHLRDQWDELCMEKQRGFLETQPHSRVDAFLDRTKQVVSTFRGGRNGNKDSHR